MKIELTKKEYRELIAMSALASGMVAILGDLYDQARYKERGVGMHAIESKLLEQATEHGSSDLVLEDSTDGTVLDDSYYETEILPILEDYSELELFDRLPNILAWRDFHAEHSADEIKQMADERRGYLGVELYPYEERYRREFEEHGFDRLGIVERKAK